MSKKKPNGIQLLIRAVVRDPDGKILSDTGRKPSKSFVIQFLEFMNGLFDGTASFISTSTANTELAIYQSGQVAENNFYINAPINESEYGIVVGTDDTGETSTDYKLGTQLTEGVGAGNITHGAVTVETAAVVDSNVDLETKRSFPNNTGSTITVKEAGIYVSTIGADFCIIRDVLGTPVDVPDMCSITVYYTIRTTV